MIKKNIVCFLLLGLFFSACNSKQESADESKEVAEEVNDRKFEGKASERDAQFVVDATSASFDEIRYADVALAKSTNAQVKKIAQQLKDEHSAMITELNSVASKDSITVPAIASNDAGKNTARLMERDVKEFDKEWLQDVKDMHETSIKKFEDASQNASDPNIKNWATTTLTKIRAHLDMISKAQDTLK